VQHLPEWFHKASAAATIGMELLIVLLLFFPRRLRLICFLIVTPWEIGVILTANYTFLNYLVLVLGILLLDDGYLQRFFPARFRTLPVSPVEEGDDAPKLRPFASLKLAATAVMLAWIAYATTAEMIRMPLPQLRLPDAPMRALEPFSIANRYGLFAVMTNGRYEIEFQGSNDGRTWTPYPFRYKPQALDGRPRIYAPYQPRFDWNLWFASLGDWRQNNIVPLTEERLLDNSHQVLGLFAGNPFAAAPPRYVRAVLWQYWFTSMQEKHATGNWWRRNYLGIYAPVLTHQPDGQPAVVQWPDQLPDHN
jgi:lipase maturation factor 1